MKFDITTAIKKRSGSRKNFTSEGVLKNVKIIDTRKMSDGEKYIDSLFSRILKNDD